MTMSKDHAADLKAAAQAFKKFQNEAELPAATRNADGQNTECSVNIRRSERPRRQCTQ
jgi:hypothetical protein